jgi:hypothetical protein
MVSNTLNAGNGNTVGLNELFFLLSYAKENGIDNLLLGCSQHVMQRLDNLIVENLRSLLFNPPNVPPKTIRDLAVFNIQRAKDHGITDYNTLRVSYGLSKLENFEQISSNEDIVNSLKEVYQNNIDKIDPWIGALCEDHVSEDALVGELLEEILKEQFKRTREGDRFWYQNDPTLSPKEKEIISNTTLSNVLKRNTKNSRRFAKDVFHVSKSKRCQCNHCCHCCKTEVIINIEFKDCKCKHHHNKK